MDCWEKNKSICASCNSSKVTAGTTQASYCSVLLVYIVLSSNLQTKDNVQI